MRDAETVRRSRASLASRSTTPKSAPVDEEQRKAERLAQQYAKSDSAPPVDEEQRKAERLAQQYAKRDSAPPVDEEQRKAERLAQQYAKRDTQGYAASGTTANAAAPERAAAPESAPVKMVNPLDKVQESLKQPNTIFPQYGGTGDMARSPLPDNMKAPARDFEALFKKATGVSFDAKSKGDRATMAELQDMMSKRADLADKSDTKVALAWYASKKK
jgi:hypothetical protein